jgi:hypothetical protein
MPPTTIPAAMERDRALLRLRDLTLACALCAAGLFAALSVTAAVSNPGHSDADPTASADPNYYTQLPADDRLSPPAQGTVRTGGGRPHTVSGGSR